MFGFFICQTEWFHFQWVLITLNGFRIVIILLSSRKKFKKWNFNLETDLIKRTLAETSPFLKSTFVFNSGTSFFNHSKASFHSPASIFFITFKKVASISKTCILMKYHFKFLKNSLFSSRGISKVIWAYFWSSAFAIFISLK